jgi:hypothetical protein
MARVRDVIQELHGQIGNASKSVGEARTPVAQAPEQMSPQDTITCGNRGFDRDWPMTCEKFLPSLLPAGGRLTVWATPDGGRTWWTKTYVGTGERIKP